MKKSKVAKKQTQTKKLKLSKKVSAAIDENNLPITQKMLFEVRGEIKADIRSIDKKMDSKFAMMDSKFAMMDSKFAMMDSKFAMMDSKLETMSANIHKIALAVEQQNNRNNVVLDGLTSLFQRQDHVEKKVQDLENAILDVKRSI